MASAELELLRKAGRHAWERAWWLVAIQVAATLAAISCSEYIPKKYRVHDDDPRGDAAS